MGDKTKIEWTDQTDNPIRARNIATRGVGHYCEKISPGCAHCYAERWQPRFRNPIRFAPVDREKVELFLDEQLLRRVPHYRKPRKIFVGDMTDVFGPWVLDEWLDQIMAAYASLGRSFIVQFLSKRAERMCSYFTAPDRMERIAQAGEKMGITFRTDQWPLPHIWLGVSIENQPTTDERIQLLLQTPAALRFVSYEPALAAVNLVPYLDPSCTAFNRLDGAKIDWVIAGGESGPEARPSHPDWFRSVHEQCQAEGVPFFFKQWGEWAPEENSEARSQKPEGRFVKDGGPCGYYCDPAVGHVDHRQAWMVRVGKKRAGRLLDGREWNEFPAVPKGAAKF